MSDVGGGMSSEVEGADGRAREALMLAGELADTAVRAMAEAKKSQKLLQEARDREVVADASHIVAMSVLASATEGARNALESLKEVGDLRAGVYVDVVPLEKKPEYWIGLLEGVLENLITALTDAGMA